MSGPPAAIVPDDEEPERRCDIHGHDWRVKRELLRGRNVRQVIMEEWGERKRQIVQKTRHTYVYCHCRGSRDCGMVVKYWVDGNHLVREAKQEHAFGNDPRQRIHAVASRPESAGTALVAWSQEHPEEELQIRGQVQSRKSYKKRPAKENKVDEVMQFVAKLQGQIPQESWNFRILAVQQEEGIICFSADSYLETLPRTLARLRGTWFPAGLRCDT